MSDEKLIGNDGKTWPQTFDADIWAKEFVERNPGSDVDTMRTWFANAIMLGYDTYRWRHCTKAKEKLAKFGALVLSKGIFNMATNEFLKLDGPGIKEAVEELTK